MNRTARNKGGKNEKHCNVRQICFAIAHVLDVSGFLLATAVCRSRDEQFMAQGCLGTEFPGQGLSLS